ncbi:HAD family hydrolase [Halalkalibacter urbisdiaboli]|uniref:HAD family hydrolase n=1 Tax=Halalkalibacter urbisdiaboli TaxID=1960589 RepID=UPI000B43C711|nr:HAD family hydrolase [Halalkalibacter urbisdiaboli]
MSVKAIFLDFYGTVVHEDGEIISDICNRIKVNSKKEDVTSAEIGRFWWNEFYHFFIESYGDTFLSQRELERISLRNTLNHFNSTSKENELSEMIFKHWMKPEIFKDSLEFFEQNTNPIYILSNIDRSDILEAINLHQLSVKEVITSEDVKSYKPRSEMFEYALKQSKLSPEEVIHVGDSLSSDVTGAKNVGIKSVWVNRNNKKINGNVQPDFAVTTLPDIFNISTLFKN